MKQVYFEIDSIKPFSESRYWQINRDYYQDKGISAWSEGIVPHHMTSNAKVGKTYAELIIAFLKDLASKGKTQETVYIIELGAGHGRLAFHILHFLEKLALSSGIELPPYCYVLSDIVESNLDFFLNHPQFQVYLDKGVLDVSYFDAVASEEIHLRHANVKIQPKDLKQPLLVLGNYFFDSLPNDLFSIQGDVSSVCSISLRSKKDPKEMDAEELIKKTELSYHHNPLGKDYYEDELLNEILEGYKKAYSGTHIFFPQKGIQCLKNLSNFSLEGMMLISMDKGFHEFDDLENMGIPDFVKHGSFSLWVNYHALGSYCEKVGGKALFPTHSNFHLVLACLFFMPDGDSYSHTHTCYEYSVNDFGPDDFNSIKKMAYANVTRLKMPELLALFRLCSYDSTFFINLLPRIKVLVKTISITERKRLVQTFDKVWDMYYNLNENIDLAYDIGGMLYDLGLYEHAIIYFDRSVTLYGEKVDVFHNKILCYYQLRQDELFKHTLKIAKFLFPNEPILEGLDQLDLNAV